MRKLIKNLILFLIIASAQGAFAYSLSYEELKDELTSKIQQEVKSDVEKYSSDYTLNLIGIPKTEIITNEEIKPTIEIINQNQVFNPISYRRIMIKDSKGNLVKSFALSVQIKIYALVMVATDMIPYNQVIGTHNTKMERREITQNLGKVYTKMTTELISKKNYQKGNLILSTNTKTKSIILKNSSVDIVFQNKSLNIKLRGKALAEGALGDAILVKSEKYNKTYTGIVKNENEVMVRI